MAHGYNPYRSHGKFAAGPHKQELVNKEGRHRAIAAKLGEQMETLRARAAHASPAVRADLKKQHDKLAARQATQRAGAKAAKNARADAFVGGEPAKRTPRKKAAPEQRDSLVPKKPPPSPTELTHAVGDGKIASRDGWEVHGLTPEAQRAVRHHFDDLAGAYGLSPRPGPGSHELAGYSNEAMGGAGGWHTETGKIALSHDGINIISRYGSLDHASIGRDIAEGEYRSSFHHYQMMVHETVHDHGPQLSGDSTHATHVEEMTTEMSARHIAAQAHGASGHQIAQAGYNEMIEGSVGHVARVAGVSREKAFHALARASIEFKSSGTHVVDARGAARGLAWKTLEHLGAVSSKNPLAGTRKWEDLNEGWHGEAKKLTDVTSSMTAAGIG